MPTLLEVQRAMRRSLVNSNDGAAAPHVFADGMAVAERLGIYRNTFISTVTRALRLSYPAVDRLVGEAFFDGAAFAFLSEQPPRSAYLNEYSGAFADFLARFPAAASVPYLADVARLEWSVNEALHAPDAEPLSLSDLAAVPAEVHGRLRFLPHPSLRLLRTHYPAETIWRAVLDEDDDGLAAVRLSAGPAWLLTHRRPTGVDVERMEAAAWSFAVALCAGVSLGQAIAEAAVADAPAALAQHLARGHFVGFGLTDPATD